MGACLRDKVVLYLRLSLLNDVLSQDTIGSVNLIAINTKEVWRASL